MRVHVVDGTFELYRAHYSKRPSHQAGGRDVKATVGVCASMLALLDESAEACTHLAIAFDNPIRSFRNDLWHGYKSDEGVPPELREQFDLVEELARALGLVVWSMREWEADDALATAAARWSGVAEVRMMTPDKDLGQCLGPGVVQVDRIRRKVTDEAGFRQRWGIAPTSLPDWLGLVGDEADGIPGLPGFGAKTATAVLARWPHLEDVPRTAPWGLGRAGTDDRLRATLDQQWDEAQLWRKLATVVRDVPLPEELAALAWRGPRPEASKLCARLGASDLEERARRRAEAAGVG